MEGQINILVVDDEEVIRRLFTDLFREEGAKISVARNGKEAIELIRENFFHIAFIDVHMPVMNGIQVVRSIREISPKTSIVMMDSFPDIFVEEVLKEGALTCIHKPFNIQEVINIVKEISGAKGKK